MYRVTWLGKGCLTTRKVTEGLSAMYQFSRAMYRELAPHIAPRRWQRTFNHLAVLHACESAVARLAQDKYTFARPAQTLFADIRTYFPMTEQRARLCRWRTCTSTTRASSSPPTRSRTTRTGEPLQCRATTRKGTPGRRTPLPRNGYCLAHQHLADRARGTARRRLPPPPLLARFRPRGGPVAHRWTRPHPFVRAASTTGRRPSHGRRHQRLHRCRSASDGRILHRRGARRRAPSRRRSCRRRPAIRRSRCWRRAPRSSSGRASRRPT